MEASVGAAAVGIDMLRPYGPARARTERRGVARPGPMTDTRGFCWDSPCARPQNVDKQALWRIHRPSRGVHPQFSTLIPIVCAAAYSDPVPISAGDIEEHGRQG